MRQILDIKVTFSPSHRMMTTGKPVPDADPLMPSVLQGTSKKSVA